MFQLSKHIEEFLRFCLSSELIVKIRMQLIWLLHFDLCRKITIYDYFIGKGCLLWVFLDTFRNNMYVSKWGFSRFPIGKRFLDHWISDTLLWYHLSCYVSQCLVQMIKMIMTLERHRILALITNLSNNVSIVTFPINILRYVGTIHRMQSK